MKRLRSFDMDMTKTLDIASFCVSRTMETSIPDFPGSCNGLQVENNGTVTKIGASVDAGIVPFRKAIELGIDFLLVHHGLFWNPPFPLIGSDYLKMKICLEGNLAVYGSHLPLDCHPEIGNNAILAQKLDLRPSGNFLPYEGNNIGLLTEVDYDLAQLKGRLKKLFHSGITAMEFGSKNPKTIAILTGSGQSAVDQIKLAGSDTLITGELKQHHFNIAQESQLNLYACGHYATETFGVNALAQEIAKQFNLPYQFVDTDCPL